MGALRTGKDDFRALRLGRPGLRMCDLNPLVAQQLHAYPPMVPTTPIMPEQRSRTDHQWMRASRSLGAASQ